MSENYTNIDGIKYIDGGTISLSFKCNVCNTIVSAKDDVLPPFLSAENNEQSQNANQFPIHICPGCQKEYRINIISSFGGVFLEILELPEKYPVECEITSRGKEDLDIDDEDIEV